MGSHIFCDLELAFRCTEAFKEKLVTVLIHRDIGEAVPIVIWNWSDGLPCDIANRANICWDHIESMEQKQAVMAKSHSTTDVWLQHWVTQSKTPLKLFARAKEVALKLDCRASFIMVDEVLLFLLPALNVFFLQIPKV